MHRAGRHFFGPDKGIIGKAHSQMQVETNSLSDFGSIPGTDLRTLEWWALRHNRSVEAVRGWFDSLGIPYRRLGEIVYYSGAVVAANLPEYTKDNDPRRTRGGKRKE